MKTTRGRGFTLVELLVVIGIIAVLISILLPSLSKARRSAQQLQCSNTLRQFGLAAQMYAQESSGFLPYGITAGGTNWYLRSQLGKYVNSWLDFTFESGQPVRSQNILFFVCPNDNRLVPTANPPTDWTGYGLSWLWVNMPSGGAGAAQISYGLNTVFCGDPGNKTWYRPHKLTAARRASECLLMADSNGVGITNANVLYPIFDPPLQRHDGRINALFADGHCATLTRGDVPTWNSSIQQAFWLGGDQ